MYAIYINDTKAALGKQSEGWLRDINSDIKDFNDKYDGLQHVTPVYAADLSKRKTWKTENAAIKYANTLAKRLEVVMYNGETGYVYKYRHMMRYIIRVIELTTGTEIYGVNCYKYDGNK